MTIKNITKFFSLLAILVVTGYIEEKLDYEKTESQVLIVGFFVMKSV